MNPGFDRSTGSAFGSAIALTLILLLSAYTYYSVTTRTVVDLPLRADSGDYFLSAYNLVNHGIYSRQRSIPPHGDPSILKPDALRSPGYPLFMAAVGRPEPTDIYLHRVIYTQGAFGVLSVLLLFLIASEFLPAGWSHAAALLAALSPHLPVMSAYLLSETWFTFLLLATLYSFLLAIRKRSAWLFLCAGLLCGLCNLTRSTVQFLPFIAVAATLALPRLRPYLRSSSLFFAGFLLIVSPWTIRNQLLPKSEAEPSLLVNFVLHGSYPGFMYQSIPSSYGYAYRFDPLATEVSRSLPATLRLIHERAKREPLKYLNWYLVGKPGFLLSWTNIDGVGDIFVFPVFRSPYLEEELFIRIRNGMYLLHWPLMVLGMLGTALVWRREETDIRPQQRTAAKIVSCLVLYAIAFHMIGAPYPRYGIPFRVLLFPLALYLVWVAFTHARRWRAQRQTLAASHLPRPERQVM